MVSRERGTLQMHHALFWCLGEGWYWGRLAGIMVRSCHALWQYVDDLLAWLDKSSSPLWASLIVVLLLILGVPMSDTVDWIGWRISVSS